MLNPQQMYMAGQGVLVGGSAILMMMLPYLTHAWSSWRDATCMPDHCFCEALHLGQILQPSNTWSSFGFVFVGMWVLHRLSWEDYLQAHRLWDTARRQIASMDASGRLIAQAEGPRVKVKPLLASPLFGLLLGLSLGLVGWASALYHATLRFVSQWLDIASMYLVVTFVILYAFARRRLLSPRSFVVLFVLLNVGLGLLQAYLPQSRRFVFACLVLFAISSEVQMRREDDGGEVMSSWLVSAVLLLVFAFGVWAMDLMGVRCAPYSIIQGHAVWHLLCAASGLCLAQYYLSEMREVPLHEMMDEE